MALFHRWRLDLGVVYSRKAEYAEGFGDLDCGPSGYKEIRNKTLRNAVVGNIIQLKSPPQAGAEPSLAPLLKLTAGEMSRVNDIIMSHAGSQVDMIPKLAGHLISSGGKRLRPMLTIAASKMFGYEGANHVTLAASVEYMHTATLLHDDVVDDSDMRRGRKTARLLWGNEASVLVGDFLLGQAFRMMVDVGSLDALRVLSNAAAVIAEGEVWQLAASKNTATTEDEYLAVINAKTAALFSAAAEVGAIVAQRPKEEWRAMRCYGKNLGLAFQLVDDALDYAGDAANLGKSVGDDFREGKITLPVVLAYRRGSDADRDFWNRALQEGVRDDADLERALKLMLQNDAIDDTIIRARHYGAIARDALAIFPESDSRRALSEVIEFCISRVH